MHEDEAPSSFSQVLHTATECYKCDVMGFDTTDGNVMLYAIRKLKLFDFGSATFASVNSADENYAYLREHVHTRRLHWLRQASTTRNIVRFGNLVRI